MLSRKPGARMTNRQMHRLLPFTNAPLFHALQLLVTGDAARFHMPGHKGMPLFSTFSEVFSIDFTETPGTGNLYLGEGVIREAELAAANYYSSSDCFFLTGGSTQGVMSMLASAAGAGGKVLFDRECHKSACHCCALLDIEPHFVYAPVIEPFGISGGLDAETVSKELARNPEIKAVFVTSPTYYGVCRDVKALSEACHENGKLLLVDAAHGAHFPSLDLRSPIADGADVAVVSAHKTLPCMGQGAMLLLGENADGTSLRENTSVFGTSSPSYPIMASMDLARAYMEGPGKDTYRRSARSCGYLRSFVNRDTKFEALTPEAFPFLDPCRLTVCTAKTDMTGNQLADALWSEYGVACEMSDERNAVFILTGADTRYSLRRLKRGLKGISVRRDSKPAPEKTRPFPEPERELSVREAWFSKNKALPVKEAEGKICARPVTPYPPGVPLIWPGEKITAAHVAIMNEKENIEGVRVVET